jgi:hypothetical protein
MVFSLVIIFCSFFLVSILGGYVSVAFLQGKRVASRFSFTAT